MRMRNKLETVDRILKYLMRSSMTLGGKAILFPGDLRQNLPVLSRSYKGRVLASRFKESSLCSLLKWFYFVESTRLLALQQDSDAYRGALAFSRFLFNVKNKILPHTDDYRTELLSSIKRKNTIHEFCCAIFSRLDQNYRNTKWLEYRTTTVCKNRFLY